MSLKNTVIDVAQSPKVAGATAAATTAMGSFLDWLPDAVISKIATLAGIMLTLCLIAVQIYKLTNEKKKRRLLDMQIAEAEQKQRPDDIS